MGYLTIRLGKISANSSLAFALILPELELSLNGNKAQLHEKKNLCLWLYFVLTRNTATNETSTRLLFASESFAFPIGTGTSSKYFGHAHMFP